METPVRALTGRWQADIDAKLAALQKASVNASGSERDRHLLSALNLCGPFRPLPDWLCTALRELLTARLPQQPDLHWGRWLMVCEGRRIVRKVRGKERPISWKAAYKYASERLASTPFAGAPSTIAKSYKLVQAIRRRGGPTFRV
jgi:hypothetical protein